MKNQMQVNNFIKRFLEDSKMKNAEGRLCIFTDLDGTVIPEGQASFDKPFIYAIKRTRHRFGNNMYFIANTGRTPDDVKNIIERSRMKKTISIFTAILGNNGATSEMINFYISNRDVSEILSLFMQNGGQVEDIRFATDNDIFINNDKESNSYYQKRGKTVIASDNIVERANREHITKITLTGKMEVIDSLVKVVKEKGYKCKLHEGNSKFRTDGKNKKRRVDITSDLCSKGIITKHVANILKATIFAVMGNDENDISMFEAAIDCNGYIVLVENEDEKITEKLKAQIKEYSERKKLGYITYCTD